MRAQVLVVERAAIGMAGEALLAPPARHDPPRRHALPLRERLAGVGIDLVDFTREVRPQHVGEGAVGLVTPLARHQVEGIERGGPHLDDGLAGPEHRPRQIAVAQDLGPTVLGVEDRLHRTILGTWGPRHGPHTPNTLGAPRGTRGAPRNSEAALRRTA